MTIPFLCVIGAFFLIYLTKIPVGIAMARLGGYDNHHPRDQQAQLTGWGKRALAVHQNSIEAFPPFAAAVIIAHLGNGDPRYSTYFALSFFAARLVYIPCYLADLASLRTSVWMLGILCTIGLFFLPLAKA